MEKQTLPELIVSPRVSLRKHTLDMAEVMFRAVDRDRGRLAEFLPWVPRIQTVEDEKDYIQRTWKRWEIGDLYDYSVLRSSDGKYLGNIGIHDVSWEHERCEIGYWILGEFEGQGYMSAAVAALEKACFDLGFHRIEIRCSSANERSAGVPKRGGYRLDGVLRQNRKEHGQFRDTLIFAKLKD